MSLLTGRDEIEPSVAIDVANCDVFDCANVVALCNGDAFPNVGITRAKSDAQMVGVFMHRNDIQIPVAIYVCGGETIATPDGGSAIGLLIIDQVFSPRNVEAVPRPCFARRVTDSELRRAGDFRGRSLRCLASHDRKQDRSDQSGSVMRSAPGPGFHASSLAMSSRILLAAST